MAHRRRLPTVCLVLLIASYTASGQSFRPEDFLPLAVGNSWTYVHEYYDERHPDLSASMSLTIAVTGTTVVNHHTYYVFSESPYDYPPIPPFAMAGKTVRWSADGDLLELTPTGEVCLFRFSVPSPYVIAAVDDDTLCYRSIYGFVSHPKPNNAWFILSGHASANEGRYATFLEFYGVSMLGVDLCFDDWIAYFNQLTAVGAVLNGRAVSFEDALRRRSTAVTNSPWGALKNSLRLR